MRTDLKINALVLFCCAAVLPVARAQEYPQAKPPAGHLVQYGAAPVIQNPNQYQLQRPNVGRAPHPEEPTNPFASHRPTGALMTEGMREAVNPCNRDFGGILDNIQSDFDRDVVRNSVTWWGQTATWLFFLLGLVAFWLWNRGNMQQARFTRAAAGLVGDRNAAYDIARNAVQEYNKMVDRYDDLKRTRGVPAAHELQLPVIQPEPQADKNEPLYAPATPPIDPEPAPATGETQRPDDDEADQPSGGGAQLEPVITASGVKYIEYAFYLRRVKALQKKGTSQTTTINQLRQRVTELEEKLESFN